MTHQDSRIMKLYFAEIKRYPLLTREQEAELAHQAQEGRIEARDRLIECNQRFVVKVARRYCRFGMPLEDLINEGNLGLIEAIRRFDPTRSHRFVSWASWWIQRSIRRALTEQSHIVRLPESALRKIREVRNTEGALTGELGRTPTRTEIGEKQADLKPIHLHGIHLLSLDEPANPEQADTLAALVADKDHVSAEDRMLRHEMTERVRAVYEQLEDKERIVISGRFGFDDGRSESREALGKRVGCTREGVRFIEHRAIRRLNKRLTASIYGPHGFRPRSVGAAGTTRIRPNGGAYQEESAATG